MPQCPEAIWNQDTQRIEFSWVDDLKGCPDDVPPTGTQITLYTFADLGEMQNSEDAIKENTALRVMDGTATPRSYKERSVDIFTPYIYKNINFIFDETYFVTSMYVFQREDTLDGETCETFGLPNTSLNPLFVPSYQVDFSKSPYGKPHYVY